MALASLVTRLLPVRKEDARIFRYFRPHAGAMIFATACASIGGVLGTGPIWILRTFGEEVLGTKDPSNLMRLAILVVVIAFGAAAAQYGQQVVLRLVGLRVVQRVRTDLVRHYERLSLDKIQSKKA